MNVLRGIGLKLLSVLCFSAMVVCIKATANDVPAGQAVFFRTSCAIPVILAWASWRGSLRNVWRTKNFAGHLWRGVAGMAAMLTGFTAFGLLPLPEVTALGYSAPLITVLLAAIFLSEKVRAFRLSAVILGLIGVLIILAPELTLMLGGGLERAVMIGVLAILANATLRAISQVLTRYLAFTEDTATIVFYFSLNTSLFALLTLPFGWETPKGWVLALLVLAGVLGAIGQILVTLCYRYAPISVVAPFEYASMLVALSVGYLVFDESASWQTLGGAALIIAAGTLILWRERQLGMIRAKARETALPIG